MYDEIGEWFASELGRQNVPVRVYMESVQRQNGWLRIPVYVGGDHDAYEKATILQDVEDAWNNREPRPEIRLLLIPAARSLGA